MHLHSPHNLNSVAEMVATAASVTVWNIVGAIGTEVRLRMQASAMEVQWCVSPINVLPTRCQPFPVAVFLLLAPIRSTSQMGRSSRRRTYALGMQCLVSLSDSLTDSFPFYEPSQFKNHPSTEPVRARDLLGPITLPETSQPGPGNDQCACDAESWPALLASLSSSLPRTSPTQSSVTS